MSIKVINIICEKSGERIDKYLTNKLNNEYEINKSRSAVKSIIVGGDLKKNDIVFSDFSYKTKVNDKFDITIQDNIDTVLKPNNIKLNIIYEDDDLLVLNKQANLIVHPGAGNKYNTLVNSLLDHCGNNLSTIGGIDRPGILHRLDKDTSGLMIVAKKDSIHLSLKKQLEDRILKRTYNAVIWGVIRPETGSITENITRNRYNRLKMALSDVGRYSKTNYKTIEKFDDFASIVECELDTGRTHQIRIHFSSKRHPIIGDQLYGGNTRKLKLNNNESCRKFVERFPRQALHSKNISFLHPSTNIRMFFETDFPEDIHELILTLKKLV